MAADWAAASVRGEATATYGLRGFCANHDGRAKAIAVLAVCKPLIWRSLENVQFCFGHCLALAEKIEYIDWIQGFLKEPTPCELT